MTETAPTEQPTTTSGSRHTRWFLMAFCVLAAVWGVRNIRFSESSSLDLLVPVATAISLCWWTLVDARRRGRPIPLLARPWFFLFAGVVVPGYVIWSRRWRGIGWVVLYIVLWCVIATIVMHTGWMFVYGNE